MKKIKRKWSENLLALTHEMFSNKDHYDMGHDAGVQEGMARGELKTYAGLVNAGKLDADDVAEMTGMTADEFRQAAAKYLV